MKRVFITGMPTEIRKEFRSLSKVKRYGLSTLIEKVRLIVSVGDNSFASMVLRNNNRSIKAVFFRVIRLTT